MTIAVVFVGGIVTGVCLGILAIALLNPGRTDFDEYDHINELEDKKQVPKIPKFEKETAKIYNDMMNGRI